MIEEREPSGGSEPLARQSTHGLYIDEALTLDRDLNANGSATDAGERLFYHANALYSVFGLSDYNRAFPERYLYDAYGRPIIWRPGPDGSYGTADDMRTVNGSSTVQNVRTFTGREWDLESLLYYYRARYQSPSFGRFLGRDPVMQPHLYLYAAADPINSMDPTGRETFGVGGECALMRAAHTTLLFLASRTRFGRAADLANAAQQMGSGALMISL